MKFGKQMVLNSLKSVCIRRLGMMSLAVGSFLFVASPEQANAQFGFNNFGRQGVVGGVRIDAQGIVRNATDAEREAELQFMKQQIKGAPGDFAKAADLRMVSLKALQSAMVEAKQNGKTLSEEMQLLGGLTRIEYVFVYPETNDIVLAGPGENWIIGKDGTVVGQKSGRPMMYLEDLVVALQSNESARQESISVSIEGTPEGNRKFEVLSKQMAAEGIQDPRGFEDAIREAAGPQLIKLTGAPTDSHLARVLFAADYQMKRYGMNLAEAPVKGLPSYVEMVANKNPSKVPLSRWWMVNDYDAIQRTKDGTAWKISGRGIKTMTAEEMVDASGKRHETGKVNGLAQKWANNFNSKMDELSVKDPIFGELRNVMDLAVVAALIDSKGLEQASGCDLSGFRGKKTNLEFTKFGTPVSIDPQCSFIKAGSGWVVSASGGVQIDSWAVADRTEENEKLIDVRTKAAPNGDVWCWN